MGKIHMGRVNSIMEREPPCTIEEAARELDISQDSYRCARDALNLFFEDDLDDDEEKRVSSAIKLVQEGRNQDARAEIEEMMTKRFGIAARGGRNLTGGPAASRELMRGKFFDAIVRMTDSMVITSGANVPYLTPEQRVQVCKDIERGIEATKDLIQTIKNGGTSVSPLP